MVNESLKIVRMSNTNPCAKSCFLTIGCRCKPDLYPSVSLPLHTQSKAQPIPADVSEDLNSIPQYLHSCLYMVIYRDYIWGCDLFLERRDLWLC